MTILLVDNHDLILNSLERILEEAKLANKILKAKSGDDAWKIIQQTKPELIISDYKMNGLNGLELLDKVKTHFPESLFLMLSMIDEPVMIHNIINRGVNGLIHKDSPASELIAAIKNISKSKNYYCQTAQKLLQSNFNPAPALTKREIEVLKLLVQEKKNKEIGEILFIDVSTVETHKKNLIKKLNVKTAIGLVKYAMETKIFD